MKATKTAKAKINGFNPRQPNSKSRTRKYLVEFNYRKGETEVYLGKIDIEAESTKNAIQDHKAIAEWTMMTILGGMDEYEMLPNPLKLTIKEERKILTAWDINTLLRCGQKPQRVCPNQAFVFDGRKNCLWRIDLDEPNDGAKAILTDVTGRDRNVWLKREFDRPPHPTK